MPEAHTVLRSRVPAEHAGRQLCDYLAARFRYHDLASWQAHCRAGLILLGERRATGAEVVRAGDSVTWLRRDPEPPVNTAIGLLHVDADLVVACKPAHLPSHADGAFQLHTFVHLLRQRLGDQQLTLVHRLDRETSGLMLVARTKTARAGLERQFRAGSVGKRYLAIVHGAPASDSFSATGAIGRDPDSSISLRRAVVPDDAEGALPARTDFEVRQRLQDRALLACMPHTGRTHQIRVHLSHAGHPLLGDKLYGRSDAEYLAFVHAVKAGQDPRQAPAGTPSRQLLHASEITFQHPVTGAPAHFEAPMPDDMLAFLRQP